MNSATPKTLFLIHLKEPYPVLGFDPQCSLWGGWEAQIDIINSAYPKTKLTDFFIL